MDKRVYLDHAATTAVHPAVLEAMKPALTGELFGNPSSVHFFGREAKKALDKARNLFDAIRIAEGRVMDL